MRKFSAGTRWLTLLITLAGATTAVPAARAAEVSRFERYGGITPDGLHAVGPPLTDLQAKLADPNWLVAWLLQPTHLRRRTLMRRFNLKVEDARAIARYLYRPETVSPSTPVPWQGGDARRGETLFVSRGCRGCHAIAAADASVSEWVPNLAGIGLKVRGDWLFTWLKSPRTYDPNTPMPQTDLSDDDTRHLVAFLLSRRDGAEEIAHAPRFYGGASLDKGRTAISRFDCPKCHLVTGFQTIVPTAKGAFLPRPCGACHEPSGVSAPLESDDAKNPSNEVMHNGRLLAAFYNCRGCHRLEGSGGVLSEFVERKTFAPPALDGEGARVQTSWLVEFLARPKPLRPWLGVRMPRYDFSLPEARALAAYFAALAHVAPVDEPAEPSSRESAERGARRFAHFKCGQCHPAGPADATVPSSLPPDVDPEDLSIDLAQVQTRLRPSWVRNFLARPKAVVGTETRMPTVFFTVDGEPKVEHPDSDIAAITAYLFSPLPTQRGAPRQNNRPGAPETPPTDWSTVPY